MAGANGARRVRRRRGIAHAALLGVTLSAVAVGAVTPPVGAVHGAPVIVDPVDGQLFCLAAGPAPASTFVSGTTVAAYEVHLREVGSPSDLATVVADGEGVFGMLVPFGEGGHSLEALAVDLPDGSTHTSEPSAPVHFTVDDVSGAIGAVTRSTATISPKNQDSRYDKVTFSVPVVEAGQVRFVVRKGTTNIVVTSWATRSGGSTATFTWYGRPGGVYAPDGSYSVDVTFRNPVTGCTKTRTTTIKVDNTSPKITGISRSYATFYPAENDAYLEFRDTVKLAYSGLTERAGVTLNLYRAGSSTVVARHGLGTRDPGSGSYTWNGRRSDGSLFTEGTYDFAWVLRDPVGNVRTSARSSVTLSHKHVVAKTTVLANKGNATWRAYESGCGDVHWDNEPLPGSTGPPPPQYAYLSTQNCNDDDVVPDLADINYSFDFPSALVYDTARFGVYGYSSTGTPVTGIVMWRYDSTWSEQGTVLAPTLSLQWFPTTPALNLRDDNTRSANVGLRLRSPCDCDPYTAFEVRVMYFEVKYGVLAPQ